MFTSDPMTGAAAKKMHDLMLAIEEALPRRLNYHHLGRDEIQRFIAKHWQQVEENPNPTTWTNAFLAAKREDWRRFVLGWKVHEVGPLIPGSPTPIFVHYWHPSADSLRPAFKHTWENLAPPEAQRVILDYWTKGDLPACVELPQLYRADEPPAKTCLDGYELCFDKCRVFDFPDPQWLNIAIVHELAHVYLFATHDPTHWMEPPERHDEKQRWHDEMERLVKEVLESWPVDMAMHCALEVHVKREILTKVEAPRVLDRKA